MSSRLVLLLILIIQILDADKAINSNDNSNNLIRRLFFRIPTRGPTKRPTRTPWPTGNPTPRPTTTPTNNPTRRPSYSPTPRPSRPPTNNPTRRPSRGPTESPTVSEYGVLNDVVTFEPILKLQHLYNIKNITWTHGPGSIGIKTINDYNLNWGTQEATGDCTPVSLNENEHVNGVGIGLDRGYLYQLTFNTNTGNSYSCTGDSLGSRIICSEIGCRFVSPPSYSLSDFSQYNDYLRFTGMKVDFDSDTNRLSNIGFQWKYNFQSNYKFNTPLYGNDALTPSKQFPSVSSRITSLTWGYSNTNAGIIITSLNLDTNSFGSDPITRCTPLSLSNNEYLTDIAIYYDNYIRKIQFFTNLFNEFECDATGNDVTGLTFKYFNMANLLGNKAGSINFIGIEGYANNVIENIKFQFQIV